MLHFSTNTTSLCSSCLSVLAVVLFVLLDTTSNGGQAEMSVSYGSAISLQHLNSGYKLFSAKISWGSGSGEQVVTSAGGDLFTESVLWYVKEPHSTRHPFAAGAPVKCGSIIRLEHAESEKNLHARAIRSPISNQWEVSAYGSEGIGNEHDNFIVECVQTKSSVGSTTDDWPHKEKIALKHSELGGYLKASKGKIFNRENCPRCPIEGHLEVVVSNSHKQPSSDEIWTTVHGVILSESDLGDEEPNRGKHDEL